MSFMGDAIRGLFGFPATGQKGPADLQPPAPIAPPPPPPTVASVAGASATAARAAAAAAQGGTIGTNPQGETASNVTGGKATLSGVA